MRNVRRGWLLVVGAGAVALLIQYLRTGVEWWPDVVCQTYLGWRLTEGDSLYTTVWDSHPPVAVLYSALFHLVLSPSESTAKWIVWSTALLFGGAQTFVAWVSGVRSRTYFGTIGLVTAAVSASTFANARSEDFVMLFGTISVFSSWRARESAGGKWAALSGAVMVFAAFSKPAAVAAGVVSMGLLMMSPRRSRQLVWWFGGAAVALLGFVVWFLVDQRYLAAWDDVVVYGRAYFRPMTFEVAKEGVRRLVDALGRAHLLLAVVCVAIARLSMARTRLGFNDALLFSWPVFEGAMAVAQTTHFPYVFFPVHASLIGISVFYVSQSLKQHNEVQSTVTPPMAIAFCAAMLAAIWFRSISLPLIHAMSLGGLAGLALAAALSRRGELPGALLAMWCLLGMLLGAATQGALNRDKWYKGYAAKTTEFAAHLAANRVELGDEILWFDVAPTFGYLGAFKQAVPEYLLNPLFYPRYATNERWTRVDDALGHVNLVLSFEEWRPLAPHEELMALPAYVRAMEKLHGEFDDLGEVDVLPYGRSSIRVLVRKNTAANLRKMLDTAYGLHAAEVH